MSPTAAFDRAEALQSLERGIAGIARQHMGQGGLEVQRQGLENLPQNQVSHGVLTELLGDFEVILTIKKYRDQI